MYVHTRVFLAEFHDQAVFKCTKYYTTCVFRIMKMLILKPVPQTKPVSVMFSRCYTKYDLIQKTLRYTYRHVNNMKDYYVIKP